MIGFDKKNFGQSGIIVGFDVNYCFRGAHDLFSALENHPFYNLSIEGEVLRFLLGRMKGWLNLIKRILDKVE